MVTENRGNRMYSEFLLYIAPEDYKLKTYEQLPLRAIPTSLCRSL